MSIAHACINRALSFLFYCSLFLCVVLDRLSVFSVGVDVCWLLVLNLWWATHFCLIRWAWYDVKMLPNMSESVAQSIQALFNDVLKLRANNKLHWATEPSAIDERALCSNVKAYWSCWDWQAYISSQHSQSSSVLNFLISSLWDASRLHISNVDGPPEKNTSKSASITF